MGPLIFNVVYPAMYQHFYRKCEYIKVTLSTVTNPPPLPKARMQESSNIANERSVLHISYLTLKSKFSRFFRLVGWLCLTSHRQRGHLEKATPFTVPCEGREARLIHRSHRELNPGPSHGSPLRYRCTMQAPKFSRKQLSPFLD